MIHLCFDYLLSDRSDYPWPNLVKPIGGITSSELTTNRSKWSGQHPWIDFPRIIDYLQDETVAHKIHLVDVAPVGSLYLVNICWFDHNTDYFSLMNKRALERLQRREIKFVIIYGEADSGLIIQKNHI
jgi:hypothetical protein